MRTTYNNGDEIDGPNERPEHLEAEVMTMKLKIGLIQLIAPLMATHLFAASRLTLTGPSMDALFQAAGQKAAETVSKPPVGQEQKVPTDKPQTKELTVQVKVSPDAHEEVSVDLDGVDIKTADKRASAKDILARYGITLTCSPEEANAVVMKNGDSYSYAVNLPASAGILFQVNGHSKPISCTWTFDSPIDSIAFERPELIAADKNGIWHPMWYAQINFVAETSPLYGDVPGYHLYGEGAIKHFDTQEPYAAWPIDTKDDLTLKGKKITSVKFVSNGEGHAAMDSVVLHKIKIRRSK